MPAIDLTYPLAAGMPVYPGTPSPVVHAIADFDRDHFRERQLTVSSHTGTHMDAPAHLLNQGKTLDHFPVDQFRGTGLCIDVSMIRNGVVEWDALQRYQEEMAESDFVLLRTGWGRYWGDCR